MNFQLIHSYLWVTHIYELILKNIIMLFLFLTVLINMPICTVNILWFIILISEIWRYKRQIDKVRYYEALRNGGGGG